MTTQLNGG